MPSFEAALSEKDGKNMFLVQLVLFGEYLFSITASTSQVDKNNGHSLLYVSDVFSVTKLNFV